MSLSMVSWVKLNRSTFVVENVHAMIMIDLFIVWLNPRTAKVG